MVDKTDRQSLKDLLPRGTFTLEQLADVLDEPVRDVVEDLKHVRESNAGRFEMLPPECDGCGFVYRDRRRIDRPSRCPECRGERISGPWFSMEAE